MPCTKTRAVSRARDRVSAVTSSAFQKAHRAKHTRWIRSVNARGVPAYKEEVGPRPRVGRADAGTGPWARARHDDQTKRCGNSHSSGLEGNPANGLWTSHKKKYSHMHEIKATICKPGLARQSSARIRYLCAQQRRFLGFLFARWIFATSVEHGSHAGKPISWCRVTR